MAGLDELLAVIENPTRRKILEALVREPHYPLQLSKELRMSQQAIMKHLKVMESYDMVRSYMEESDLGGPSRRLYIPALNFTLIVDIGPNLFSTEIVAKEVEGGSPRPRKKMGDLQELSPEIIALREDIADIDDQLNELQQKRTQLIEDKENKLDEAGELINQIDDYQLRRIIYEFTSRPELSAEEIARELSLRDEVVVKTLEGLMEDE